MNATDNFNLLINNIINQNNNFINEINKRKITYIISRTDLSEILKYLDISFIENYSNEILDFKNGYENLYLNLNQNIDTIYSNLIKFKLQNDISQFISYNDDRFIKLHMFENMLYQYKSFHYMICEIIEIINKLIDCIKFIDNKLNIENNLQKVSFKEIIPYEEKVILCSKKVKDCEKDDFCYFYFPEMESDKFNQFQSNKPFTFNLENSTYIEY